MEAARFPMLSLKPKSVTTKTKFKDVLLPVSTVVALLCFCCTTLHYFLVLIFYPALNYSSYKSKFNLSFVTLNSLVLFEFLLILSVVLL